MSTEMDRYRRVARNFADLVAVVPADGWTASSPCEGWTARDVVVHVLEGTGRTLAQVTGGEYEPPAGDGDLAAAVRERIEAVDAAVRDPDTASRQVRSPLGPMTAEQLVGTLGTVELLVHTWDLARAVGGDERLDEDAVRYTFDLLAPLGDRLRAPGAFGPAVEPPPDADLQTRLMCLLGRPA